MKIEMPMKISCIEPNMVIIAAAEFLVDGKTGSTGIPLINHFHLLRRVLKVFESVLVIEIDLKIISTLDSLFKKSVHVLLCIEYERTLFGDETL